MWKWPSRRIAGVVVDDTGQPIADAELRVVIPHARMQMTRSLGRTDTNGRFDTDCGSRGTHLVVVNAPGDRDERRHTVRTGETSLRLTVPATGSVTGRVVLDGASVTYFGVALRRMTEQRSSDGRFTLAGLAVGTGRIQIVAPGACSITLNVDIAPHAITDLGEIVLERAQRIIGHVRDVAGAPVARARVVAGRWMAREPSGFSPLDELHFRFKATTTRDGVYALDVDPVIELHVWATHRDRASRVHALTDARELVLVDTGTIEVDVEAIGQPEVLVQHPDEPDGARTILADAKGRYAISGVPVGEYTLRLDAAHTTCRVRANQTARARLVSTAPRVTLSISIPLGRTLQVEPIGDGAGLDGRVVVRAELHDRTTFEHRLVRPGTYRLSIDGIEARTVTIAADPVAQTIDLRP